MNILAFRQSESFNTLNSSTKTIIQLLLQHHESLEQTQSHVGETVRCEHDRTRNEIIRAIDRTQGYRGARNLHYPAMNLRAAYEQEVRKNAIAWILDSLAFRAMEDRFEEIEMKHRETFEWIYDDSQVDKRPWSDFPQWLRYGDGTFWIAGKAGSGKSTLMKYLYSDHRTREYLKVWAGNLPLLVLGFFFWNVGTDLQKSIVGLLRSLLHQVVCKHEELIPVLFAERWHEYLPNERISEQWSGPELARAFRRLIEQNTIPAKFCFLIDGLDEYDGDHAKIVELLQSIPKASSIKVCASSRPLIVFEDAFIESPKLMLQHLTFSDIERYVTNKIAEHATLLQLQIQESEYQQLITEIVERASGVFLWVKLVVKSLLDGLSNGDGVSDLQARLRLLPTDLKNLYVHMLTQVEPIYRGQAWKLFQIVLKGESSLTTLEVSFADEELQFAIDASPKLLTGPEQLARCRLMARRLKSRCKGLLEIHARVSESILADVEAKDHELLDSNVVFLHKTVKDFLEEQDSNILFGIQTDDMHNPSVCMMTSDLLTFKFLRSPTASSPESLEKWIGHFLKVTVRAIEGEWIPSETIASVVESVEETLRRKWFYHTAFSDLPLADQQYRIDLIRNSKRKEGKRSGLALAIQFNLEERARDKLDHYLALNEKDSRPLLDYALFLRRQPQFRGADPPISRGIVGLLLERGADPNECYHGSSPWQNALSYICLYTNLSEGTQRYCSEWLTALKLLLEHGADPDAHCHHEDDNRSMTKEALQSIHPKPSSALTIIKTRFPASAQRLELEALLKQKQDEQRTKNQPTQTVHKERPQNIEKPRNTSHEKQIQHGTQAQVEEPQAESRQELTESKNDEKSRNSKSVNHCLSLSHWLRKMSISHIRIHNGA